MGRPRKDGSKAVAPQRVGKARPTAAGGTWRVRAYGPTAGAMYGRVVYRRPETGKQTSSVPKADQTLDELFDQVERALDKQVAMAGRPTGATRKDIAALGELYLASLRSKGRDEDYIDNRASLLRKWVTPAIGTVLVADWSADDSQKVITNARASIGPARLEDLGSTLSGLRRVAHAKRPGGRWLSPDENPMEDVEYTRGAAIQGAHRNYLPPAQRPSTALVNKAVTCAGEVGRWPWMPLILKVGAFCSARQGEQLGLRAVDLDLLKRHLDINGVWHTANKAPAPGQRRLRSRKPQTKNKLNRITPFPASMLPELTASAAVALGMPADTSTPAVAAAITAEQERRAALTKSGDWRDARIPPDQECWLFTHEPDQMPPSKEMFNAAWHTVRDAVGWPTHIPYKNLRHHSALWLRSKGFEWEEIAAWDGHDVLTLESYYRLPASDSAVRARRVLDKL